VNVRASLCCLIVCAFAARDVRSQDLRPRDFHIQPTATNASTPRGNFVIDFATDPVTHAFWIATDKGPSVSIDGGKSWKSFYGDGAFMGDTANCAAIAAKNNVVVVSTATTKRVGDQDIAVGTGIHVSTDGGTSWTHYPQPKDKDADTVIHFFKSTLKALPVTVDEQNVAYSVALQGTSTIWIASFAAGTRKSTDLGKTWQRVILPPTALASIDTNTVYHFAVTPVPAIRFTGTDEANLNYEGFSVLVENDSTIWAGTADGINRSTDGGTQWHKFNHTNSRITGNFVVDLKLRAPGEVWASTASTAQTGERTGISFTTDDGTEWHAASDILVDTSSSATSLVHKIAFLKTLVYAVNDEGVWRSADNGVTWLSPSLIFNKDTRDVITGRKMLSVGTFDTTVFIGTSDCLVSTGDSPQSLNPFGGPWVFYCFAQPISTGDDGTYAYPNPFQPTLEQTRIRFKVIDTQPVTVEIFDFKMRLLRTVIREVMRSGGSSGTEFKELWDGSDNYGHRVANATYFYKVTIGTTPHWGKILVIR
jgi:hypothetical protein